MSFIFLLLAVIFAFLWWKEREESRVHRENADFYQERSEYWHNAYTEYRDYFMIVLKEKLNVNPFIKVNHTKKEKHEK